MAQISREIKEFSVKLENGTSYGWTDTCFQIPIVAEVADQSRRRRSIGVKSKDYYDSKKGFNPSVHLPSFLFCAIVEALPNGCMIQNLLELWNFDEKKIGHLTKQDILNALHSTNISLTTGHESNFERLLGEVTRNETGHIVAAKGLLTHWMVYVNFSNVNHDQIGNSAGTEGKFTENKSSFVGNNFFERLFSDWASVEALLWENEFLNVMESLKEDLSEDKIKIYYSAGRRYVI